MLKYEKTPMYPTQEELRDLRERFVRGEDIPADELREVRNSTASGQWIELCRQRERLDRKTKYEAVLGDGVPLQVKLDAIITLLMEM